MAEDLHVCVDRLLEPAQVIEAARLALEEDPANAPDVRPRPGVPLSAFQLAALTGKKWANGRALRVRFMGGAPEVRAKVERYARLWEPHCSIRFAFGDDPAAELRVAFQQGAGSWSYLGVDALTIPRAEPTMNFGWLTADTSDEEYERVVCHEFGHALACFHEHMHPEAGIPWDREAVYRYYTGPPNNWTREEVDRNLFRRYDETLTQHSAFDPSSIMIYPIPNAFTVGDYEVGWTRRLSEEDKRFIGELYPRPGAAPAGIAG